MNHAKFYVFRATQENTLSLYAILVYSCIAYFNKFSKTPTLKIISQRTGLNVSHTIPNAIKELANKELLTTGYHQNSTTYTIVQSDIWQKKKGDNFKDWYSSLTYDTYWCPPEKNKLSSKERFLMGVLESYLAVSKTPCQETLGNRLQLTRVSINRMISKLRCKGYMDRLVPIWHDQKVNLTKPQGHDGYQLTDIAVWYEKLQENKILDENLARFENIECFYNCCKKTEDKLRNYGYTKQNVKEIKLAICKSHYADHLEGNQKWGFCFLQGEVFVYWLDKMIEDLEKYSSSNRAKGEFSGKNSATILMQQIEQQKHRIWDSYRCYGYVGLMNIQSPVNCWKPKKEKEESHKHCVF